MTKICIEKNIPLPAPRTNASEWPFAEMHVGESFLIDSKRVQGCYAAAVKRGWRIWLTGRRDT